MIFTKNNIKTLMPDSPNNYHEKDRWVHFCLKVHIKTSNVPHKWFLTNGCVLLYQLYGISMRTDQSHKVLLFTKNYSTAKRKGKKAAHMTTYLRASPADSQPTSQSWQPANQSKRNHSSCTVLPDSTFIANVQIPSSARDESHVINSSQSTLQRSGVLNSHWKQHNL